MSLPPLLSQRIFFSLTWLAFLVASLSLGGALLLLFLLGEAGAPWVVNLLLKSSFALVSAERPQTVRTSEFLHRAV